MNVSLDHFKLACYELTIHPVEPLELPPYKGSALRGGFGHTFKRLACFDGGFARCHIENFMQQSFRVRVQSLVG